MVSTPDREVQETVLEVGDTYDEVRRMREGRLPAGVRDRDTYLPRHSDAGDYGADEVRRLVEVAERQSAALHERRRVNLRADMGGHERFLIVYQSEGGGYGNEITPPSEASRLTVGGKNYVLFHRDGQDVLARGVEPNSFEAVRAAMKSPGEREAEEQDVRILPVLFDTAEERWRTILEAVPDFLEVDFDDFPLQGPRTILHDARQLRRLGLDFVQHHEGWVKKSGVRHSDRSVHEHASICRALNYMMCYDQLNLGGLASAEALNRRRTLIEHAHQGRPDAPSYEGSEEFLGVRESSDGSLIDPALQAHAAKRQATKAEILKQTRLAAEEKRLSKKGDGKGKKDDGSGGGPVSPEEDERRTLEGARSVVDDDFSVNQFSKGAPLAC